MENKHAKLVPKFLRKSSEIDDLMNYYQNSITAKEELVQLNNIFKMLVGIHAKFEEIDKEHINDPWFNPT